MEPARDVPEQEPSESVRFSLAQPITECQGHRASHYELEVLARHYWDLYYQERSVHLELGMGGTSVYNRLMYFLSRIDHIGSILGDKRMAENWGGFAAREARLFPEDWEELMEDASEPMYAEPDSYEDQDPVPF